MVKEKEQDTQENSKDAVEQSKQEKEENQVFEKAQNDAYLRLLAEFENFKKRTQKEQQYWITQIKKGLIMHLLPILDDFERALKHGANAQGQEEKGMILIHKKLLQIVEKEGLKKMGVQVGDVFDAHAHEALSSTANDDTDKKDKIVEVVEQGYLFNGDIIRFAKVIVNA